MIDRRVVINLVTFFVAASALIAYGAISLLGNPFDDPREVKVVFEDASGVLPDFSASLSGVIIGTVASVDLVDEGVEVTIDLDPGKTVPSDAEARIIRASAVGEQRVDFTPTKGGMGEPVPDGGTVPAAADAAPPEISVVLDKANQLIAALPVDDLNTVVHEAAVAFRGRSDEMRAFAPEIDTFNRKFLEHETEFRKLLETSPPLLDALVEVSPELRSALENTAAFTRILADRRADMTRLMENGASFAEVAQPLLDSQLPNLACLFSDAADLNDFLADPVVLRNIELGLDLNQAFFGPIESLAVEGRAIGFPQYGSSTRADQAWLRVSLMFPPGSPTAINYSPIRRTPDVLPGVGCTNAFGDGVGPAGQAGAFVPEREERLVRGQTTATDLAPFPAFPREGGDTDAGPGAGDRPVTGDDTTLPGEQRTIEGPTPDFFAADGSADGESGDDVALDASPASGEGSDNGWIWLVATLFIMGGGLGTVAFARRRAIDDDEA